MPALTAPADPEVRHWRSRYAAAARHHGPTSPRGLTARRGLTHAVLAAEVRAALADDLLTQEHRRDLADMLAGDAR